MFQGEELVCHRFHFWCISITFLQSPCRSLLLKRPDEPLEQFACYQKGRVPRSVCALKGWERLLSAKSYRVLPGAPSQSFDGSSLAPETARGNTTEQRAAARIHSPRQAVSLQPPRTAACLLYGMCCFAAERQQWEVRTPQPFWGAQME